MGRGWPLGAGRGDSHLVNSPESAGWGRRGGGFAGNEVGGA